MRAQEQQRGMSPLEAAQALIDAGGKFLLNHSWVDKKTGKRKTGPKHGWSIPRGGTTDSDRRIIRRKESEHNPYTAKEVVAWVEDDDPDHRVGLLPWDIGMVVVDFDSGSDSDQQAWQLALGDNAVELRSRNGRGKHLWFRRPEGVKWGDLKKASLEFPALTGGELVRADFIPCNGQTILSDSGSLVRLAECLGGKGGVMPESALRVLAECVRGGSVSRGLGTFRGAGSGSRHNVLLHEAGKLLGGRFRSECAGGLLERLFVAVGGCWDDADIGNTIEAFRHILTKQGNERLAVLAEIKAKREERGESVEGLNVESALKRGDVFPVSEDGLSGILDSEGWSLGLQRRGGGVLVKWKHDSDWAQFGEVDFQVARSLWQLHYRKPGGDEDPKPWWLSKDQTDAFVLAVAKRLEVDPFKHYLDGLDKVHEIEWGDDAERELMAMPRQLWSFSSDSRLVGLAFRYALCGAVARCYERVVKHDSVLVLVGEQALGKSGFVEKILPPSCRDLYVSVDLGLLRKDEGDKALGERIGGKVFGELAEIKHLGPELNERVKQFLARTHDDYRSPYAKRSEKHVRDAIFIGTSNRPDPLYSDPSGNRRYHAVRLSGFADDDLERDLDGIEHRLDGGLRDRWWALAKACWQAKRIDSHRPVGDEIRLFSANESEFERVSEGGVEVSNLADGMSLSDGQGWAVPCVPLMTVADALGLVESDMRKGDRDKALGLLRNRMARCGWDCEVMGWHEGGKRRKSNMLFPSGLRPRYEPRFGDGALARLGSMMLAASESGEPSHAEWFDIRDGVFECGEVSGSDSRPPSF